MSQVEFDRWVEFYIDYPFDDMHRYHRPAALIAQSMGGGDIKDKLEWLAPEPLPDGMSAADLNTLKAFGFTPESTGDT
jgi:hypothetical protein